MGYVVLIMLFIAFSFMMETHLGMLLIAVPIVSGVTIGMLLALFGLLLDAMKVLDWESFSDTVFPDVWLVITILLCLSAWVMEVSGSKKK